MKNSFISSYSPRQRMINLMYLVFIAMLALDYSSGTEHEPCIEETEPELTDMYCPEPESVKDTIVPAQVTLPEWNPSVTISHMHMNVLYAGYPNEIKIVIPGVSEEQIKIQTEQAGIVKGKAGRWIITPEDIPEKIDLLVSYPWAKGIKRETVSFRVIPLPLPTPFLVKKEEDKKAVFKGGNIQKQVLSRFDRMEAIYEDVLLNVSFEIISFDLIWTDSFGNRLSERTAGPYLSERQKQIISSFPKEKQFHLSQIQVKGEDGILRTLPSMKIILI